MDVLAALWFTVQDAPTALLSVAKDMCTILHDLFDDALWRWQFIDNTSKWIILTLAMLTVSFLIVLIGVKCHRSTVPGSAEEDHGEVPTDTEPESEPESEPEPPVPRHRKMPRLIKDRLEALGTDLFTNDQYWNAELIEKYYAAGDPQRDRREQGTLTRELWNAVYSG